MSVGKTPPSLLLQPVTGYPDSYVSARLGPRLRDLFSAPSSPITHRPAEGWDLRRQAVVWSYGQLSPGTRQQLEPIYLYMELPLLITAIRFKVSGQTERAKNLFSASLWSHNIRRAVMSLNLKDTAFTELRALLTHIPPRQDNEEVNLHPLNRFEKQIFEGLFLSFKRRRQTAPVRKYCAALVDLYNLARSERHNHKENHFTPLAGGKLKARDFNSTVRLHRGVTLNYGYTNNDFSSPAHRLSFTMARALKQRALRGECLDRICAYLWANMSYPDHLHHGSVISEGSV